METISLQQNYTKPIVLCLGFFDCMHTGHVKLLNVAKGMAQNAKNKGVDAKVALFTFENNHFETLKRPTKLIYTFDERKHIYESLGVETVVSARFDTHFMALSGGEFLQQIAKFNLVGVVCGTDYTCGSDMLTSAQVAQFFSGKVPVEIVDLLTRDGQKVGSTLVRKLLSAGEVDAANGLLSQPFFFLGKVVHGRSVGKNLGFPTVNLAIPPEKLAPAGVYFGSVRADGTTHLAVINVGAKPTFCCDEQTVEAHLLNFDGNLYGKQIVVSLEKYLRPVIKFENAEKLSAQLEKDIRQVYCIKEKND